MGKDKLRRFAEIATFKNVVELDNGKAYRENWSKEKFGNGNPLILELACGKGEYTVNLARLFPDINFIGVDYKGNRIWRGAKTALEDGIENVAFLRIQIENILDYFGEEEVSEIWITFPDPQPQISREKKRLTSPRFLEKYRQILKPGGFIHLKTDNDGLYGYTLETIASLDLKLYVHTNDVYADKELAEGVLGIKTYYEKKYLSINKNINYIKFGFD